MKTAMKNEQYTIAYKETVAELLSLASRCRRIVDKRYKYNVHVDTDIISGNLRVFVFKIDMESRQNNIAGTKIIHQTGAFFDTDMGQGTRKFMHDMVNRLREFMQENDLMEDDNA